MMTCNARQSHIKCGTMVSLNRDALTERVLAGKRISPAEAVQLYQLPLEELGVLADENDDGKRNAGPTTVGETEL